MNTISRPQTVLVIDDDAIMRLMTTAALEDAGYLVAEAASAEDGCARFERDGADLVLMDVILPGMNGFEACVRLRGHAAGANVPIIVMTGLDDRQSILAAYESGATDFITKPIVWNLLPYRVQYALRASAALQETVRSRALLSRSEALAQMGSWEWRRAGDRLQWSDEMHRLHGSTPDGVPLAAGALLEAVLPEDRAAIEAAFDQARASGQAYGIAFRIRRPDGSLRRVFEQTDVECDAQGGVVAVRGIRRDITREAEADERIRTLASFDPLTGLANRAMFRAMVRHWLPHAQRQGMRCAVLDIDLDRFKLINESHGQPVGDAVLQAVGERLRDCLRAADPQLALREPGADERLARLGVDEFTVLLVDIGTPEQADMVARRILAALARPIVLAGQEIFVEARIGISMTPDDGDDMDALLRNAGTAMHAAKRDPQHRVRFYDGAMSAKVQNRLRVENELRRAIDAGELRLHYQAKVDMRTSQVVGAEALLRWEHPTRGLVGPFEFIPVAEACGLIVPMTRWVLDEVCRQLATWRAEGIAPVPVSINLDAASLQGDGLVDAVEAALTFTGLPPSDVEFEVTESSLMNDLDRAVATLTALRGLGVRLAIDDFGTGYSSLTYLKRFPVDVLKIDRAFVSDLTTDASDAALTTAIIAMGHSLGLELIAEGVETWAQADFLTSKGCVIAQGFLFARPLPADGFIALLQKGL